LTASTADFATAVAIGMKSPDLLSVGLVLNFETQDAGIEDTTGGDL
jgi:hypothetical protein